MFFFEKKNQKTFTYGLRRRRVTRKISKVFCVFFSKKKTFHSYAVTVSATFAFPHGPTHVRVHFFCHINSPASTSAENPA